jgi:hypothetical protein
VKSRRRTVPSYPTIENTIHFLHLRSTFEKYDPLSTFINQLVEKSLGHWDRNIVLAYALFGVFAISAATFGLQGDILYLKVLTQICLMCGEKSLPIKENIFKNLN